MAKYRIQRQWPVLSIVVEGGAIIDTALPQHRFFEGVVPPPDSQPLDQQTRDWLVAVYPRHERYPEIPPVPPTEVQINEQTKATRKAPKSEVKLATSNKEN